MSIDVVSNLAPKNNGTFPTHLSKYGKGGWHEATSLAERDAIPMARRVAGMACIVSSQVFLLNSDLSTWREVTFTGIEDAPVNGKFYARQDGLWVEISLDGGVYA